VSEKRYRSFSRACMATMDIPWRWPYWGGIFTGKPNRKGVDTPGLRLGNEGEVHAALCVLPVEI